jgi:hypothetical protein
MTTLETPVFLLPSPQATSIKTLSHHRLVMSKRARSPTRAQLSSKLAYEKKVPAFLRKLQNQYGGGGGYRDDDDEDGPSYDHDEGGYEDDREGGAEGGLDEFGREIRRPEPELDEFGREVRRPPIPTRPPGNPGNADENEEDEDFEDERPQVVVLKEGKHLTEREAENMRRKGSCYVCLLHYVY